MKTLSFALAPTLAVAAIKEYHLQRNSSTTGDLYGMKVIDSYEIHCMAECVPLNQCYVFSICLQLAT